MSNRSDTRVIMNAPHLVSAHNVTQPRYVAAELDPWHGGHREMSIGSKQRAAKRMAPPRQEPFRGYQTKDK